MRRLTLLAALPLAMLALGAALALWAVRARRRFDDLMLRADSEWWGGETP